MSGRTVIEVCGVEVDGPGWVFTRGAGGGFCAAERYERLPDDKRGAVLRDKATGTRFHFGMQPEATVTEDEAGRLHVRLTGPAAPVTRFVARGPQDA